MAWQNVCIKENNEKLVKVGAKNIWHAAAYNNYPFSTKQIWVRETVGDKLRQAGALLDKQGLSLILLDGWRDLRLQTILYHEFEKQIAQKTGLVGKNLDKETQRFVCLPSSSPNSPSPHLTGGSVDVLLGDGRGFPLCMGGKFDEISERSATHFYKQGLFYNRRQTLLSVMQHVGFSNYKEEWWHYDFGNQFHHHRVGGTAAYGPTLLQTYSPISQKMIDYKQ